MTQTDNSKRTAKLPPFRVTDAERSTIADRARGAGLSLSDYARRACLQGVVVARNAEGEQAAKRLAFQLASIGNNLNQIARAANIHGGLDPDRAEQLSATLAALSAVLRELS